jgi:hypothetical protein
MFLDDKIYGIGSKLNLKYPNVKQAEKLLAQIARATIDHCIDALHNPPTNEQQCLDNINIVKRTDKSWRIAVERLDADGRGMIDPDGFKNLIQKMNDPWPELHKQAFGE